MGLLRRVSRARLAGQVVRRLRRAGLIDVRYDARAFQVRFAAAAGDVPTIIELAPLLADHRRGRRRRVDNFVAGLLLAPGVPGDWATARPLLRSVLRGGTPGAPLRRPVLPFLSEFVVVDQPDTMTYVGPEQLAAWRVTADEVFSAARANLSGAVLHGVATEPVVVQFVDDGDAYWTSHLLLEHWLERLAGQVGGVPVAFAPERGTLLVTADASDHLRGLFAQAEEIYLTSARPITPMAYVSDEKGCPTPYRAPAGHPLHREIQRAERLLAVREYARQAAQLAADATEPGAASHGDDTGGAATPSPRHPSQEAPGAAATPGAAEYPRPAGNLAELRLMGSSDTGWRTRAIWERDEPVLLPVADEVLIGDVVRPWDDLVERLTVAAGMDPIRWSATGWPPR